MRSLGPQEPQLRQVCRASDEPGPQPHTADQLRECQQPTLPQSFLVQTGVATVLPSAPAGRIKHNGAWHAACSGRAAATSNNSKGLLDPVLPWALTVPVKTRDLGTEISYMQACTSA